jgi:hypothetical protein
MACQMRCQREIQAIDKRKEVDRPRAFIQGTNRAPILISTVDWGPTTPCKSKRSTSVSVRSRPAQQRDGIGEKEQRRTHPVERRLDSDDRAGKLLVPDELDHHNGDHRNGKSPSSPRPPLLAYPPSLVLDLLFDRIPPAQANLSQHLLLHRRWPTRPAQSLSSLHHCRIGIPHPAEADLPLPSLGFLIVVFVRDVPSHSCCMIDEPGSAFLVLIVRLLSPRGASETVGLALGEAVGRVGIVVGRMRLMFGEESKVS